jgi:hypothetical protein
MTLTVTGKLGDSSWLSASALLRRMSRAGQGGLANGESACCPQGLQLGQTAVDVAS